MMSSSSSSSIAFSAFATLLLLFVAITSAVAAADGKIGVNYGRIANNLPAPSQVVQLLKTQRINRIKLYDTESSVLSALANTDIFVVVGLPNENLSSAAADQSFTDSWVQNHISPYLPATKIEAIAVGNEVFVDPNNTTLFLVPAITNLYASLVKYKLDSSIKLSSPIALSALGSSYPSSAGSFKSDLIEPVIKPLLSFLKKTDSYLMANVYPFFAYESNADVISLDYALLKENAGVVDSGNGLKYTSLFDAQLDAVFAAMSAIKFDDLKVVVTETGWPSIGDENEVGAGSANAAAYNGNLVKRVLSGSGTPLRPNEPLDVYLFALFNENQKSGPTSERNYGLFYPNQQKVYDISLTLNGETDPFNGSKTQVPIAGGQDNKTTVGQSTWCVANEKAGEEKLQAGLDYACGEGGADCTPIQPGSTCADPDTIVARASYAFNSYYQKKSRGTGTCDFDGAAYVVTQAPKFGKCEYPTGV